MRLPIILVVLTITTPVYAQTIGTTSGATSLVEINNPSTTTSTTRLITAPPVSAPGLAAAGIETCLGSTAGGLSLMGGGFSFGSTKVDDGCTIRLLARQLYAFGFQKAAVALMCQDRRVTDAMDAAGSPCPIRPDEVGATGSLSSADPSSSSTAEASEPVEPPVLFSFLPTQPSSQEQEAWFNRASNMN